MEWFRRGIADHRVAFRYYAACDRIEAACDLGRRSPEIGILARLGDAVADLRLAATPGLAIDPSGMLEGLDDDELAEWWEKRCVARILVETAAERGEVAAIDWTLLMTGFAENGDAFDFGRRLADGTEDVIAAVMARRNDWSGRHDAPGRLASSSDVYVGWSNMPFGSSLGLVPNRSR